MRVLLLNPPADNLILRDNYCSFTSKAAYYWPPIDLLVLSGLLKNDFDVHILDCITNKMNIADCTSYIKKNNIEHIVFVTGTASWKEDTAAVLGMAAKAGVKKIVASGGNLLSKHAEYLERYPEIDAVVTNYAINDVKDLLLETPGKVEYSNLYLSPSKYGQFLKTKRDNPKTFSIPVPLHDKFPLEKYRNPLAKGHPFTSVMTSFGCPYTCSYCIASILDYSKRDRDNFLEEMSYIKSLGVNEVWINDWTFNIGTRHPIHFAEGMIENKLNMKWFCQCRANAVTEEMVAKMKESGCHTVQIGVESADQEILDRYYKSIDKDQIHKAFQLFKKYKIRTLGYFMIGLPGDTERTVNATIKFSKQLECDFASFAIATPDVGTQFRQDCIDNNWIKEDEDVFDSSSTAIIDYGGLSSENIVQLRNKAIREFYFRPAYVVKRLTDIGSLSEFKTAFANAKNLFLTSKG